jgi:hypothetical protein
MMADLCREEFEELIESVVARVVESAVARLRAEESKRLDDLERTVHTLVMLLKGDDDGVTAGLVGRVKRHQATLYGAGDREFGVVQKVNVMWRAHTWLLCTASAGVGGLAVWLFERFRG